MEEIVLNKGTPKKIVQTKKKQSIVERRIY